MNKTDKAAVKLLELGMSQCVICGKDAETCEHYEEPNQPEEHEVEGTYSNFNRYVGGDR